MDYEKKYKEVLKQIKECTPDENGFITIYPQEIFPELKESEDERIRKRIIHALHGDVLEMSEIKEAITWLEKQGDKDKLIEELGEYKAKYIQEVLQKHLEEQKPVEWSEEDDKIRRALIRFHKSTIDIDGIKGADIIAWLEKQKPDNDAENVSVIANRDDEIFQAISVGLSDVFKECGWSDFGGLPIEEIQAWLEKQGEQKPVEWSEEDERNASYICAALDCYYRFREDRNNTNGQEDLDKARNWLYNKLKSLRPQPKQEWSEEDENIRKELLVHCQKLSEASNAIKLADEYAKYNSWVALLKSLKERVQPQNTWKPSDEQIKL